MTRVHLLKILILISALVINLILSFTLIRVDHINMIANVIITYD